MRRRAARDGTLYQEKRTRNGRTYESWVAEIMWHDDGIRHRSRVRRSTQYEAREQLERMRLRIREGSELIGERKQKTVEEAFAEWLEKSEARRLRPATINLYRQVVNNHLVPVIGRMRAHRLRWSDMLRLLKTLERAKASERVRELAYIVAKAALSPYVRHVSEREYPFPRRFKPKVSKRDHTVWSAEEARAFLEAAKADRYFALYYLALATGARQGELLGLRWRDVHHDYIVIRAAFDQRQRKTVEPKTKASLRRVDVAEDVGRVVQEHRERMKREGTVVAPDAFVFTCVTGEEPPFASNLYRRSFFPLMEQAQVPIVRFHDLRHCSATMLLAANVNPKIVQRRLGHTSIKTTMDVYSSYLPGMQIDAARALSAALVPPAITPSAEKLPVPRKRKPAKS